MPPALPPQPVGAGNYIIHLIRTLSNLESEFEFVIFAQPDGWQLISAKEHKGIHWVKTPSLILAYAWFGNRHFCLVLFASREWTYYIRCTIPAHTFFRALPLLLSMI